MTIPVDMMADEAPGDDQLNAIATAMIREKYAVGQEMKIHRMMILNPADPVARANFDAYNAAIDAISADLSAAKTQAALLRSTLAYEQAYRFLAAVSRMPTPTPMFPQAEIDAANATVRGASADVLALAKMRGKI